MNFHARSNQGETLMGWSLGHSQEKKCNSTDKVTIKTKMKPCVLVCINRHKPAPPPSPFGADGA